MTSAFRVALFDTNLTKLCFSATLGEEPEIELALM
jgi:hypothetical protein